MPAANDVVLQACRARQALRKAAKLRKNDPQHGALTALDTVDPGGHFLAYLAGSGSALAGEEEYLRSWDEASYFQAWINNTLRRWKRKAVSRGWSIDINDSELPDGALEQLQIDDTDDAADSTPITTAPAGPGTSSTEVVVFTPQEDIEDATQSASNTSESILAGPDATSTDVTESGHAEDDVHPSDTLEVPATADVLGVDFQENLQALGASFGPGREAETIALSDQVSLAVSRLSQVAHAMSSLTGAGSVAQSTAPLLKEYLAPDAYGSDGQVSGHGKAVAERNTPLTDEERRIWEWARRAQKQRHQERRESKAAKGQGSRGSN
ncbi:hypothetical protein QBC39DRAFT_436956 [Podospora conica]|nr:hypothetical protein QBC39DRAFT_436956 [Schizothecium conicum]